ncbi:MAG: hypothetical protein AAF403_00450, partial [Pseudomonadota bacterium]
VGFESKGITIDFSGALVDTDASETLVIYIEGTPTGANLSAGTLSGGIWTLQQSQLSGLKFTPLAHSDADFTFKVTALTSEDDGTHSIITSRSLFVSVSGVADTARLQTVKASTLEDKAVTIEISSSFTDTDGSETLAVYIRGAPTGASLSSGTLSNNIWTLQQTQLSGLKITPNAHSSDEFTLSVTSLTSEDDGTHSIFTTASLAVKVGSVIDTARLQTVKASGFEDLGITLQISTSLKDTDGSETLVIYISGAPTGVSLSAGTFSSRIWTLQQSQLSGLKITPLVHLNYEFTISVTALTSEDDGLGSTFTTSSLAIKVSSIADTAKIQQLAATTIEDRVGTISISSSLVDTDGTETLVVYIGGAPTGTSLSVGTFSNSIWTLQQAQLSGLKITLAAHFAAEFTLSVTSLTSEDDGTHSTFITMSLDVTVIDIADTARLQTVKASGLEDKGITLQISTSFTDTDGSETLVVYISGAPTGASLSAGTLSNNIWTLQQTQLSGLKITPNAHSSDEFTFSVTSLTSENNGTSSVFRTAALSVNVGGIADSAKIETRLARTRERTRVTLFISAALRDTDGSETLVIYISNTPTGASLSAGTLSSGVWTVQQSQLSGLSLAPGNNFTFTINVSAITSEDDEASTHVTKSTLEININELLEPPILNNFPEIMTIDLSRGAFSISNINELMSSADFAAGNTGGWVQASSAGTDVAVQLNTASFFNVPATHSGGINDYMIDLAHTGSQVISNTLTGLRVGQRYVFEYQIANQLNAQGQVASTNRLVNIRLTGASPDPATLSTNNLPLDGSFTTLRHTVTVSATSMSISFSDSPQAGTPDPTRGALVTRFSVKELEPQAINQNPATITEFDTDGSQSVSVVIANVPASITLSAGVLSSGRWTLSPAQFSTLKFTPTRTDIADFTFQVSTVASEVRGRVSTVVTVNSIAVDTGVADADIATATASTNEGVSVLLNLSVALSDTDGSETIESILISNIPTGASLSSGTLNSGVWTLQRSDLNNLKITTDASGDHTLIVTATAREFMTGTTNKTASRALTLTVSESLGNPIFRSFPNTIQASPGIANAIGITRSESTTGTNTIAQYSAGSLFGWRSNFESAAGGPGTLQFAPYNSLITGSTNTEYVLDTQNRSVQNISQLLTGLNIGQQYVMELELTNQVVSGVNLSQNKRIDIHVPPVASPVDMIFTNNLPIDGSYFTYRYTFTAVASRIDFTMVTHDNPGPMATGGVGRGALIRSHRLLGPTQEILPDTLFGAGNTGGWNFVVDANGVTNMSLQMDTATTFFASATGTGLTNTHYVIDLMTNTSQLSSKTISGLTVGQTYVYEFDLAHQYTAAGALASDNILVRLQSGPVGSRVTNLSFYTNTIPEAGVGTYRYTFTAATTSHQIYLDANGQGIEGPLLVRQSLSPALQAAIAINDTDGSETLTVLISGTPAGVSLSAGRLSNSIWTLTMSEFSNLKFTPPATGANDFIMQVTAINRDISGLQSKVEVRQVGVDLGASALNAVVPSSNSGQVQSAVLLVQSISIVDTDGSETVNIYIRGVPAGASLSSGTLVSNVWTVAGSAENLRVTYPTAGNYTLTLTIRNEEIDSSLQQNNVVRTVRHTAYSPLSHLVLPGLAANTRYRATGELINGGVIHHDIPYVDNPSPDIVRDPQFTNWQANWPLVSPHGTGGHTTATPLGYTESLFFLGGTNVGSVIGSRDTELKQTYTGLNVGQAYKVEFFVQATREYYGFRVSNFPFGGTRTMYRESDSSVDSITNVFIGSTRLATYDQSNLAGVSPSSTAGGSIAERVFDNGAAGALSRYKYVTADTRTRREIIFVASRPTETLSFHNVGGSSSTSGHMIGGIRLKELDPVISTGNPAIQSSFFVISGLPSRASVANGTFVSGQWSISAAQYGDDLRFEGLLGGTYQVSVTAAAQEISTGRVRYGTVYTLPLTYTTVAEAATLSTNIFEDLFDAGNTRGWSFLLDLLSGTTGSIQINTATAFHARAGTGLTNTHYVIDLMTNATQLSSNTITGLTIGQTYVYEFDLAHQYSATGALASDNIRVRLQSGPAGQRTTNLDFNSNVIPASGVGTYSYTFTATATNINFYFDVSGSGAEGPLFVRQSLQSPVNVNEDSPFALPQINLADTDGSETISLIEIHQIPTGTSLSAGSLHSTNPTIWTGITGAQLQGLRITPPAHLSGSLSVSVRVTTSEIGSTSTRVNTLPLIINIAPVLDTVTLRSSRITASEGVLAPLNLDYTGSADPSESISFIIRNVPANASITGGNFAAGAWTIAQPLLSAARISIAPSTGAGTSPASDFTLSISALNIETSNRALTSAVVGNLVVNVLDSVTPPTFNNPSGSTTLDVGKTRAAFGINDYIYNSDFTDRTANNWAATGFTTAFHIIDLTTGFALELGDAGHQVFRPSMRNLVTGQQYVLSFKLARQVATGQNDDIQLTGQVGTATAPTTLMTYSESNLPAGANQFMTFNYTFTANSATANNFSFSSTQPSLATRTANPQDAIAPLLTDVAITPVQKAGFSRSASYGAHESAVVIISGVPAGYRLSTGTVVANRWTVASDVFENLQFTPPSSRADFAMQITAAGLDTTGGHLSIGAITTLNVRFQGSLENLVVDYDEVSSRDDEFTLALNHHDVDEDAIIFYRVSNVDQGTGFRDLYGQKIAGSDSGLLSEDEARQVKVSLSSRDASHRLDITQYVVKTSVNDSNLKIDKGVSAGSQNLARQDFSFDVDRAWQAYIGGQVASLRTAYRIKVDKRYYTLDLGATPITSASALASRIEFAIAADQTLGLLFKADSNGSDVTLKSKHIGGFKHLVEVDGVLGAPDLGVRSTLTQISSGMNAHIL